MRVEIREESGAALIAVTDNGVGIAPGLLPKVFDLFVQGERTLDRAQGGLGIGLSIVRRLVEMHGGRVNISSSGEQRGTRSGHEALRVIEDYHPEIVLLDIGLPGIDGYEVAGRIRAQPKFEGVKLVALTGYGQEGDRARTRDAGFSNHLVKPVDFNDLKRTINSAE